MRLYYRFHPRAGQLITVVHAKRFAGKDHLVVVQPDGTLALIPAWMSGEAARSATVTSRPCYPLIGSSNCAPGSTCF